jgi:predicted nucleic acid-binding protein
MARQRKIETRPKVFVDTVAWIALVNRSDNLRPRAQRVMKELRRQKVALVTTEFVLLEVADALCAPTIRAQTVAYLDGLRRSDRLQIVSASQDLLAEGWSLYSQRLDKDWGMTDCTSFVVMTREQIKQAFTSDHHFEQAGFIKLL